MMTQWILGGHSAVEPPDPIPNSEVKRSSADDSVGSPHVKVGHCQGLIQSPVLWITRGFLLCPILYGYQTHTLGYRLSICLIA